MGVTAQEIADALGQLALGIVGDSGREALRPATLGGDDAEESLAFCSYSGQQLMDALSGSRAAVIIAIGCDEIPSASWADKTIVLTTKPRLAFIRTVNRFFAQRRPQGIHETAVVDRSAVVHPSAYVGPHACIGPNSTVGEGSVVHGGVYIYANVRIGRNVTIHACSVIGADGFGYERNEDGGFEKFPHLGGVLIEDDVEIGANTCVDRGSLADTIVRRGAKIDNLVHIAHNCDIGEDSAVVAAAVVAGSTKVGRGAWISPNAIVRDGIVIGEKAFVGMGAVVTKSVPPGETVLGNPAVDLASFRRQQAAVKKMQSEAGG